MNQNSFKHIASLRHTDSQMIISMYMSLDHVGHESRQNKIRLKNLFGKAEKKLQNTQSEKSSVKTTLNELKTRLQDELKTSSPGKGLALFITGDAILIYWLPITVKETVTLSDKPCIRPLIPLLEKDGPVYLLALSQKKVALYCCDISHCEQIPLKNGPEGMKDVTTFEDPEKQLQFTTMKTSGGKDDPHSAVYHGQGKGEDDDELLLTYLRLIDQSFNDTVGQKDFPLFLATVDELYHQYKKINTYSNLDPRFISGNPDKENSQSLHNRVFQFLSEDLERDRETAFQQYQKLASVEPVKTSTDLERIIPAAHEGRIERLFVDAVTTCRGRYDEQNRRVKFHKQSSDHDEELINFVVFYTLLNSGKVSLFPGADSEKPPYSESSVAAAFRY
jgi:hypothetical protein